MDELSKLKEKISGLEKENSKLKKNLTFYKDIVDQVQIQLHINNISKPGSFNIEWANKFHTIDSAINKKERNKGEYYIKHYRPDDKKMMDDVSSVFKADNKPHSMVYHYLNGEGEKRWHYTSCIPFRYSDKGELTHILCATVNLTNEIFNSDRYIDMVKELNNVKYQLIISKLTKTELSILKLLSSGKTEKEIAFIMSRSIHTVKTHIKNIREKLNFTKNTELVTFACKTGIS